MQNKQNMQFVKYPLIVLILGYMNLKLFKYVKLYVYHNHFVNSKNKTDLNFPKILLELPHNKLLFIGNIVLLI